MGECVPTGVEGVETNIRVIQEAIIERRVVQIVQKNGIVGEGTVGGIIVEIIEKITGSPGELSGGIGKWVCHGFVLFFFFFHLYEIVTVPEILPMYNAIITRGFCCSAFSSSSKLFSEAIFIW